MRFEVKERAAAAVEHVRVPLHRSRASALERRLRGAALPSAKFVGVPDYELRLPGKVPKNLLRPVVVKRKLHYHRFLTYFCALTYNSQKLLEHGFFSIILDERSSAGTHQ